MATWVREIFLGVKVVTLGAGNFCFRLPSVPYIKSTRKILAWVRPPPPFWRCQDLVSACSGRSPLRPEVFAHIFDTNRLSLCQRKTTFWYCLPSPTSISVVVQWEPLFVETMSTASLPLVGVHRNQQR